MQNFPLSPLFPHRSLFFKAARRDVTIFLYNYLEKSYTMAPTTIATERSKYSRKPLIEQLIILMLGQEVDS